MKISYKKYPYCDRAECRQNNFYKIGRKSCSTLTDTDFRKTRGGFYEVCPFYKTVKKVEVTDNAARI